MRIGVIGDTHIPALSSLLPTRIGAAFKGLDIILHVGDICELYVLEELQETYTLTFAVSGEQDSEEVRHYLDGRRIVQFGGRRVGMIHGHQFEEQQRGAMERIRRLFGWKPDPAALPAFLLEQFAEDDVHAVMFGHTHRPYVKMHGGVLLFNPGAAVARAAQSPSVGILDIGERRITGRIVIL